MIVVDTQKPIRRRLVADRADAALLVKHLLVLLRREEPLRRAMVAGEFLVSFRVCLLPRARSELRSLRIGAIGGSRNLLLACLAISLAHTELSVLLLLLASRAT